MLTVDDVNKVLKVLNKRVKVKEYISQKCNAYFFKLSNGKILIVFYEKIWGEYIITSILEQQQRDKPYSYLCNGQAGKNTNQIYKYNYNEDGEPINILKAV